MKVRGRITQDGREDGKSLAHQQVRFILAASIYEQVRGLWMGLDNMVSLQKVQPYIRKKDGIHNPVLTKEEKSKYEDEATKILKKVGIMNVKFVWVEG